VSTRGGGGGGGGGVPGSRAALLGGYANLEDVPAFKQLLQKEQRRIRSE
jgi:hypothetical protein